MDTVDDVAFEENEGDEDEEAMTAAEVLQKLEEAWLNEKFAPELLENKSDIVECMMSQIQEMEENIQRAKKGDFKVSLHRMEIDRIRYVLSSYLRIRLKKIEKFTAHLLQEEATSEQPRLSPEEMNFAKQYQSLMESHMTNMALKHMPPNLQKLDQKLTSLQPNLDSYIFFRVNDDVEGVLVDEETAEAREEIIDLKKGDQHVMMYRPIRDLVACGSVSLI